MEGGIEGGEGLEKEGRASSTSSAFRLVCFPVPFVVHTRPKNSFVPLLAVLYADLSLLTSLAVQSTSFSDFPCTSIVPTLAAASLLSSQPESALVR